MVRRGPDRERAGVSPRAPATGVEPTSAAQPRLFNDPATPPSKLQKNVTNRPPSAIEKIDQIYSGPRGQSLGTPEKAVKVLKAWPPVASLGHFVSTHLVSSGSSKHGQFLLDNVFQAMPVSVQLTASTENPIPSKGAHHASIHRAGSCGYRRVLRGRPVEGREPALAAGAGSSWRRSKGDACWRRSRVSPSLHSPATIEHHVGSGREPVVHRRPPRAPAQFGKVTPAGDSHDLSIPAQAGTGPYQITSGADGNLWMDFDITNSQVNDLGSDHVFRVPGLVRGSWKTDWRHHAGTGWKRLVHRQRCRPHP